MFGFVTIFWATFITIIAFLVRHRFTYWSRHGVKGANYPIILGFLTKYSKYLTEMNRRFGPIYGTYFMTSKWLVVNEPNLLGDILIKNFHIFRDRYDMNLGSTNIQKAVFFMKGDDEWKRIRSILTPAFTSGKLRAMMANISNITNRFVDNLDVFAKNGQTVDMRKYFGAFAMDVICDCAYGINVESIDNPNHPIVVNAKKILSVDSNMSYILSIFFPPIAKFLKLEPFDRNAINYFDDITQQIVNRRKTIAKTLSNNSNKRLDFIQIMINNNERHENDLVFDSNSDEESKANRSPIEVKKTDLRLSDEEMTAQGILFFIAGYDTTSAALSHVIYYLSKHKECQQTLYEELQTLNNEFSYENLNHLKYLNAVINETLRLSPPLPSIQRDSLEDYQLGNTGITIPAGTTVEIQPFVIHRDPRNFADPDHFKPERFLEPTHHPYAFLPFGGGPRLCVGMRFAMNEMRICIANVINRFEFSLEDHFQIDYFTGNIILTPKQVLVKIKRRN